MKIITLLEMEIACLSAMTIWLFLISSSQSIQIGDNFFPHVTTTTDAESNFDGKCLNCRYKDQFTTELFGSQENLYMDYEETVADTTTSEPLTMTSIDMYETRNQSTNSHQHNPDDIDQYDVSSDEQFKNSHLFGSLLGSKEERLTNTDSSHVNQKERKRASIDGMWFGPRLGRRNKRLNNNEETTNTGMWFGPRLGRRERRSDDSEQSTGMWFGPRLGRRNRRSGNGEAALSGGMWFGPRLGRRDRRSGNDEEAVSASMWFGPRLGRRDRRSSNGEEATSASMWFGPRLGRRDRRSSNGKEATRAMWFGPRLGRRDRRSNDSLKYVGKWFNHRLGRLDRYSKKHEGSASTNMWSEPRLGKRSANNGQTTAEGMWFGLGQRNRRSHSEETSQELLFGPQMGRKEEKLNQKAHEDALFESQSGHVTKKSCNNEIGCKDKKLFSNTSLMYWTLLPGKNNSKSYNFTPRLGRDSLSDTYNSPRMANIQEKLILFIPRLDQKEKKTIQRNANIPNSVLISSLLSGGNKQQPDYVFTPRLGREVNENKQFSFEQNIRSTPKKSKVHRKYMFFTPRLGRYVNTY